VVVRSAVTGLDSSGVYASTPKYHAADKQDSPPSKEKRLCCYFV